jgi:hypothetical protein
MTVTEGKDPDGLQLNSDLLRWNISDEDQAELITYRKTSS